jgi:cytochrome c-type biogenesis protein CcmH/NrfF
MAHGTFLGLFVVGMAVLFQLWVTFRVYRSRLYEPSQKSAQAKLIWLLPVLGAVIAFSVLTAEEQRERRDQDSEHRDNQNRG